MKHYEETRKWVDPWHMALSDEGRLLWGFLCAACSEGMGVWQVNWEYARMVASKELTPEKLAEVCDDAFMSRFIVFDDGRKWYLRDYIEFQQNGRLGTNRFQSKVQRYLESVGIYEWWQRGFEGYETPELDFNGGSLDRGKKEQKEVDKAEPVAVDQAAELRNHWNRKRKVHYGLGVDDAKDQTETNIRKALKSHSPEILRRCIDRYFEHMVAKGWEGKYIKKVSNFFGRDGEYQVYLADDWALPTKSAEDEAFYNYWR